MYRTVKPPPKVNPMAYVGSPSPPKPHRAHEHPVQADQLDFEAAVRAEMEKLEQELRIESMGLNKSVEQDTDYSQHAYHPPSQPLPRAKGGGISELYGPSDDRQNMKAAKAAQYSHQLDEQRREREMYAQNTKPRAIVDGHLFDRHPTYQPPHDDTRPVRNSQFRDHLERPNPTHFPRDSNRPDEHMLRHHTPPRQQTQIGGRDEGGGGMTFGMDTAQEKAMRRAKQEEYRRQLDASHTVAPESPPKPQMHMHFNRHQPISSDNPPGAPLPDHHQPPLALSNHSSRDPHPYYSDPADSRPHPSGPSIRHADDMHPRDRQRPLGAIDNFCQDSSPQQPQKPSYTGRVNKESNGDVDKATKRRQQEQYRLQLEQQAREVAERKEREKKLREEEDKLLADASPEAVSSSRRTKPQLPGKDLSPVHPNQHHESSSDNSYYHDIDRQQQSQMSARSPPASPSRLVSPNKTAARNRLLSDVYGGRGAFPGAEGGDDNHGGKISMRGADVDASKKKAAMREQQQILQQQIEENKKRKEDEAKRERLEDELEEKRSREAMQSANSPKNRKKHVEHPAEEEETEAARRARLGKAAAAVAAASLQQAMNEREAAKDHRRDISNSPPPTNRRPQQQSPQSPHTRSSRRETSNRPPQIPQSYPLLDELGMPLVAADNQHPTGRRAATPGGALASESHMVSVGRTTDSGRRGQVGVGGPHQNSRSRLHSIYEDSYQYREHVDEDDLFVVDWQHHHGFPTKRGSTPGSRRRPVHRSEEEFRGPNAFDSEQSFVSESKMLTGAEPWGPGGLLAELSVQRLPPQPKFIRRRGGERTDADEMPLAERSLASESLLVYAGNRTPNKSAPGSRHGVRTNVHVEAQAPAASIDFLSEQVPNSPLAEFVSSMDRRGDSPPPPAARGSGGGDRGRRVMPHKYDPRQSNQQIDRLIAQSRAHIGDNLLLDNGNDFDYMMGSGGSMSTSSVRSDRPLTSAGRALSSGGSAQAKAALFPSTPRNGEGEEEVLVVPSSSSKPPLLISRDHTADIRRSVPPASGKYMKEEDESDMMLSSCGEFHVQSVTPSEREMMKQMMELREHVAAASSPHSHHSSRAGSRPTSTHNGTASRPSSTHADDSQRPTSHHSSRAGSRPTSTHNGTASRPSSTQSGMEAEAASQRPISHHSSRLNSRGQARGKWQTSEFVRDETVNALRSARSDHVSTYGDRASELDEYGGYYDEKNFYHDAHGNCYDQEGNYFDADGNYFEAQQTSDVYANGNGEYFYDVGGNSDNDYDEQMT